MRTVFVHTGTYHTISFAKLQELFEKNLKKISESRKKERDREQRSEANTDAEIREKYLFFKNIGLFCENNLTIEKKHAIIVNCIIIAYYARICGEHPFVSI